MEVCSFPTSIRSPLYYLCSLVFAVLLALTANSAQAQDSNEFYELIRYTGNLTPPNSFEIEKLEIKTAFSKENLRDNDKLIVVTLPAPIDSKYLIILTSYSDRVLKSGSEVVTLSGELFKVVTTTDAVSIKQSQSRPLPDGFITLSQTGNALSGTVDISKFQGTILISNNILRITEGIAPRSCANDDLYGVLTPTPTPTEAPLPPDDSGPPTTQPPTEPPIDLPPDIEPPTNEPPVVDPPTEEPPTSEPPTEDPPTEELPPTEPPPTTISGRSLSGGTGTTTSLRSLDPSQSELDLLIVYTPDLLAAAGSGELVEVFAHSLVEQANNFLRSSRVAARFRIVGVIALQTNGSGTAVTDLSSLTTVDSVWDEVHTLRDSLGADIVTLMEDNYLTMKAGNETRPLCGIGWIPRPGTPAWASDITFNVISALFSDDSLGSCGARVLAHEIGHNLGLDHDKKHSVGGGAYNDSHGNRFMLDGLLNATIMSYLDSDDSNGRFINYFSNSEMLFDGIASGVEGEADEAASLNRVVEFASRHRDRQFVNLSGRITDGIEGISAVNILVDGEKLGISGPDGSFTIVSPKRSGLKISVQSTGREFSPPSLTLEPFDDISNILFLLTKDLGSPISGKVRVSIGTLFGNKEIADVEYRVNGSVVSDRDLLGTRFMDVPLGSDVVVSASHPQFDLIPTQFVIPAINRNESRVFQAEEGKQWITGRIRTVVDQAGNQQEKGVPGVKVSGSSGLRGELEGNASATSLDGFYRLRNAQIGSKYYLTPTLTNYHFFPPVGNVAPEAPITVFNFQALDGPGASLSGTVHDQFGEGIGGVGLVLTCTHPLGNFVIENVSTDDLGKYIFSGLPAGSKCTIGFSKRGYQPEGQGTINIDNDIEYNPVLTRKFFRVLGLIRDLRGAPMKDVLLSTAVGAFYTDELGRFQIEVSNGSALTVLPEHLGFYFDPPYCDSVSSDGSDQACDFKAIPTDDTSTPFKIMGPPKIVPGGGTNGEIQIKINFIITTGTKPSIQWQIRKRQKSHGKKSWGAWKKIKGATEHTLTLKTRKYSPGQYQVRALVRTDEIFRSKPTNIVIKKFKKAKKQKGSKRRSRANY